MRLIDKFQNYFIFFWISIYLLIVSFNYLSLKYLSLGKIPAIIWIISYLLLISIFLFHLVKIFITSFSHKTFFTLVSLVFVFFIVITNASKTINISGEATQEISCVIKLLSNSPDLGYNSNCLLGYPSRQFYLPSLPSFIGRSIFNLNFGNSIYFILGIIIFSSGVIHFLPNQKLSDWVTGCFILIFFHIYYFNYLLFSFEQAFYPFCFSLIFSGTFLLYLKNRHSIYILLTAFLLQYSIYSYTPSLSLVGLVLLVSSYFVFDKKTVNIQKILLTSTIIFSIISIYLSLTIRQDMRLVQDNSSVNISQVYSKAVESLTFIYNESVQNPFISPVFSSIFVITIILFLTGALGLGGVFVTVWMVATIIVSTIALGYAAPPVHFAIHRATHIFPIYLVLILLLINKIKSASHLPAIYAIIIFLFIAITGYRYQSLYLKSKSVNINSSFVFDILPKLKEANYYGKSNISFVGNTANLLMSVNDHLNYFYPNLTSQHYFIDQTYNCSDPGGLIYLTSDDYCYPYLSSTNVLGTSTETNLLNLNLIVK